jgi:hypothetical protein
MDILFFLLFLICLVALVIGLFNPKLVVRWGAQERRNRTSVFKYYGIGILLFFVLTGVFAENTDLEREKENPNISETSIEETVNADKRAAIEVDSKIESLGDIDSITLEKSNDVEVVRTNFDSLNSEQKRYVTKLEILIQAEDKLLFLQEEADKEAAAQAKAIADQEAAAQAKAIADQEAAARAAAEAQTKAELESAQSQNNYTVYITKTGEKYHRDGCQYLRQSKISISKSDAVNAGYTPCSRCNP